MCSTFLRNTPETANLKIIMLTALSQESDKQRAQGLGVDDYLVKSQVVISDVVDPRSNTTSAYHRLPNLHTKLPKRELFIIHSYPVIDIRYTLC